MKVVLSPNPYRDKGFHAVLAAEELLRRRGVTTSVCLPFHPDETLQLPPGLLLRDIHTEIRTADMLICFGGDGTILHAARLVRPHNVPILGVNMGSVGFMAELESSELELLSCVADRKYRTERRMMIDLRVLREGRSIFRDTALNDAVVTKGAVAREIDITVTADRVKMMSFSGDGVIVCTPTGSTAYSMSAGGPIVEPSAENLIVTPICAHDLMARACVLHRERVVGINVGQIAHKSAYLSADGGRAFRLNSGDTVEIRTSSQSVQLVRLTGRSFYEILNHKLGKMD